MQKLPVNNFEWIKDNSQLNADLIKKTIMKKVMIDIFLKLMFNIFEKLPKVHNDLPFLPERMKIKKSQKACSLFI